MIKQMNGIFCILLALVLILGCTASGGVTFRPHKTVDEKTIVEKKEEPKKDSHAKATESTLEDRTSPTVDLSSKRGQKSGLQAGYVDDNKQFNRFNEFLAEKKTLVSAYQLAVQERIVVKVGDKSGASLANARVTVTASGNTFARGLTYADGTFLFFPQEHGVSHTAYNIISSVPWIERNKACGTCR